jgi:hypothetical protein
MHYLPVSASSCARCFTGKRNKCFMKAQDSRAEIVGICSPESRASDSCGQPATLAISSEVAVVADVLLQQSLRAF